MQSDLSIFVERYLILREPKVLWKDVFKGERTEPAPQVYEKYVKQI